MQNAQSTTYSLSSTEEKKVDLPICLFAGILYRFHAQSYTQFTTLNLRAHTASAFPATSFPSLETWVNLRSTSETH